MKQTAGVKTKIIIDIGPKVDVVTSTIEVLNAVVINEVARNPELELCEEFLFPEDSLREDPSGLTPEFVEPADEWENGQEDDALAPDGHRLG